MLRFAQTLGVMKTYSASLHLQATSLSIGIGAKRGDSASIWIYVETSLQTPKLVTLEGTHIQPEGWLLSIGEGEDPDPESAELGAIGWISYIRQIRNEDNFVPESCRATLYLPKAAFQQFIALVSAGAVPKAITIEVAGLRRPGLESRNIDIWDVKNTESLPITGFRSETPVKI